MIVKSIHKTWSEAIKARKQIAWLLDGCGFAINIPKEGKLMCSRDNLILDITFQSEAAFLTSIEKDDIIIHETNWKGDITQFTNIIGKMKNTKNSITIKMKDDKVYEFVVPKEENVPEVD